MPKLKTKKAARSRFRITSNGKVMRFRARRNHLLSKRTRKAKRQLRDAVTLANADARRVKKMLVK
ncbi:50S ribosomal protein L35 [candidate division WOR-3 bacterium JGI_Cruoil_03_44_89]|uniref:Large ribosomal subunit protein bL35 n=1 Tax=candidate division WOR-3 bacterium JGI_Cruoil_03_44_89 TaxID=1973748 RepID=A0A235BXH1_UNCW3|nr:MAG: 50S ribosomal protein L35 [candidate division WOR-3 bacterium JGI_Cruoil_03_44_89]